MPLNKRHLYIYDEHGEFVQMVEQSKMNDFLNRRNKVYNSDGGQIPSSSNQKLSERWATPRAPTKHSEYDSDDDSDDDSAGTCQSTSVQTRSQVHCRRNLFPKKDEMDSDWEPSDNEWEDPTYETESEDEYDELDLPYEEENWYYNNFIKT